MLCQNLISYEIQVLVLIVSSGTITIHQKGSSYIKFPKGRNSHLKVFLPWCTSAPQPASTWCLSLYNKGFYLVGAALIGPLDICLFRALGVLTSYIFIIKRQYSRVLGKSEKKSATKWLLCLWEFSSLRVIEGPTEEILAVIDTSSGSAIGLRVEGNIYSPGHKAEILPLTFRVLRI